MKAARRRARFIRANPARDIAAGVGVRKIHFEQSRPTHPQTRTIITGVKLPRGLPQHKILLECGVGQAVSHPPSEIAQAQPSQFDGVGCWITFSEQPHKPAAQVSRADQIRTRIAKVRARLDSHHRWRRGQSGEEFRVPRRIEHGAAIKVHHAGKDTPVKRGVV